MSQLRQAAEVPWPERAAPFGAHKAADNLRGMPVEDDDDDDQLVTFRIGDQHVPALSSTEALAAGLNKPGQGSQENHVTTPHKPSLPNSAAAESIQRPHRFKSPAPSTPNTHTHITTRRRSFIPPPPSPLQSITQRSSEVQLPAAAAAAASQSGINRGAREVSGGVVGGKVEGSRQRGGDSGDVCEQQQQQLPVAHPKQRHHPEHYHDNHPHDKSQRAPPQQHHAQQPQYSQQSQHHHLQQQQHQNHHHQQQPQEYPHHSHPHQQQLQHETSVTEGVDRRSHHNDVPVSNTQARHHDPQPHHQHQQSAHRNNSSPPPTTDTNPLSIPPAVTTHSQVPPPPIHDEPLPPPPHTASSTSYSGLTRTPVRAPPLLSSSHSTPTLLPSTSSSSGFTSPIRAMMSALRRRVPGSGGSKSCPPNLTPTRRHAAAAQEAHASTPHAAAAAAAGRASVRDKVRQIEARRLLQSHATPVPTAQTHANPPSSTHTHTPHTDVVSGNGSGGDVDAPFSAVQAGTSHVVALTTSTATQSDGAPTDTHTAAAVGLSGGAHRGVRVSYGDDTRALHGCSAGSIDREGSGQREGVRSAADAVDTEEDDIGERRVTSGAVVGGGCGADDGGNVANGAGTSPRLSGSGSVGIATAVRSPNTRAVDTDNTAFPPPHTQVLGSHAGAQSHIAVDVDRLDSFGGDRGDVVAAGRGGGNGGDGDVTSGGVGANEGPSGRSDVTGHTLSGVAGDHQHARGIAIRGVHVSSSSSSGHGNDHTSHSGADSDQRALSGAFGGGEVSSSSSGGHGNVHSSGQCALGGAIRGDGASSSVHGSSDHISDGGVSDHQHATSTEARGGTSSKDEGLGGGAGKGSTTAADLRHVGSSSMTTGTTDIHDGAICSYHTDDSGGHVNVGHVGDLPVSGSSYPRSPDHGRGVRGSGSGSLYADWAHVSPSPSTTPAGSSSSSSSSTEGLTHTDAASHTQQPTSATVTTTSSSSGQARTHMPVSSVPTGVDGEPRVINPPSIRNWLGFLGNGALSPNHSASSSLSTNQAEAVSISTNRHHGAGDDGAGNETDRGTEEEEDAGQCTNEGQDAGEQDGPTRRLSAGLSMRYEAFSQAEVDMIVNRRLEEERVKHKAQMEQERSKHEKERSQYQAQVQELESRASEAEVQAQNSQSAMDMMEAHLAEQLDTIQQSFHQRIAETQKELQHREIQLKALSSQAVDHSTKMDALQQDLDEANRRLGAADVEKLRLVREYEDKLEHEHSQRDLAVSQELHNYRTSIQKKFDLGNTRYKQLHRQYEDAVKELDILKDQCEHLEAQNAELSQAKTKLEGYVKKLEDDLVAVRVTLSKKDEDIAALAVSLESKASEARAAAHEAAAARQDRDVAYQSLSRITVQLAEATSNSGALQARVRSLQTDNSELEGMCALLMERCEVLQQDNDVLKQQLQQQQPQQQTGQQA